MKDNPPMSRLTINIHLLGGRSMGSSRLRGYMLADGLRAAGQRVRLNSTRKADVTVFENVLDAYMMRRTKERGCAVVLDLDDNHFLDEWGRRDRALAVLALADAVTAGSRKLLEDILRLHSHVYLFENPVDVAPGTPPKQDYTWQGRLGWFGNAANQTALWDLPLDHPVTTVTRGGDIKWRLKTIDNVLKGFDLVLIPVIQDEWYLSKNANRLLKCVALGVPFLASDVPEHARMAERFDLPDWLLVQPGQDWDAQIDAVQSRYGELREILHQARERVLAEYSVEAVARAWLDAVPELFASRPLPNPTLIPQISATGSKESAAHRLQGVFIEFLFRNRRLINWLVFKTGLHRLGWVEKLRRCVVSWK